MDGLTRASFLRMIGAGVAGLALPARGQEAQTVRVGCVQLPTNGAIYIGMDKGYFAQEGIKVELKWFTAAASVFTAVVSGDIDVGASGTTAATYNLGAKGGFKVIGGTTRDAPHFPLNAFLASNKAFDAGFTTLSKMAGRRFAMTTAGSTHQYDIAQAAKKYAVPISSIALVPLESYGNISAALQSNQVDGAILPPALSKRMIEAKSAHFLAWSGDEVPMQQGVMCASPQTLSRKHDLIARFMTAAAKGAAEYHRTFNQVDGQGDPVKGPEFAELIAIIARYAGIKPEEAESQVTYIIGDLQPDRDDILRQIAFWQEAGMVPKGASFANFFDLSFLPGKAG